MRALISRHELHVTMGLVIVWFGVWQARRASVVSGPVFDCTPESDQRPTTQSIGGAMAVDGP